MLAWHLALAAHPWVAYKSGREQLQVALLSTKHILCSAHPTLSSALCLPSHSIHILQPNSNRLTLVVMPSAQPTVPRSGNHKPRAAPPRPPVGRPAAPQATIQIPGGSKRRVPLVKAKHSATPGASSAQFSASNARAAKARSDMAKLSPAVRKLHVQQPYCPAGGSNGHIGSGSNIHIGPNGIPSIGSSPSVRTEGSLVSHYGTGIQALPAGGSNGFVGGKPMSAGNAMSTVGRTLGSAAAATGDTLNDSVAARLALGTVVATAAGAYWTKKGQRKEAARRAEALKPMRPLTEEEKTRSALAVAAMTVAHHESRSRH